MNVEYVSLPQTICAVGGCTNKLDKPNNTPLTAQVCKSCHRKIQKDIDDFCKYLKENSLK